MIQEEIETFEPWSNNVFDDSEGEE